MTDYFGPILCPHCGAMDRHTDKEIKDLKSEKCKLISHICKYCQKKIDIEITRWVGK